MLFVVIWWPMVGKLGLKLRTTRVKKIASKSWGWWYKIQEEIENWKLADWQLQLSSLCIRFQSTLALGKGSLGAPLLPILS